MQPRAEGYTVGFVGRLEKRKGIETLTAAIPAVLKAVPQATFRFVGASESNAACRMPCNAWIRRRLRMYSERLEFAGKYPLDRMAEAYDGIDICVFPSRWENFPNVCLEAMAAARAVIASSAGGVAEMLDGGRVGRLVPPDDPAAVAGGIVTLLRKPGENRIALGEMARKRVLEAYNERVIGEIIRHIYTEAIARAGRRTGAV